MLTRIAKLPLYPMGIGPVLGTLAGALLGAAVIFAALQVERQRLRAEFVGDSEERIGAVLQALEHSVQATQETATFVIATGGQLTDEQFRSYAMQTLARHPFLQAIGWNQRVLGPQLEQFEAQARRGYPSYRVYDAASRQADMPIELREEYFPVYRSEPLEFNQAALGFDVYSEPLRRAAVDRARRTERVTATAPIELVQMNGGGRGFLVFAPLLLGEGTRKEDRLSGLATSVVRADKLIETALSMIAPAPIMLELTDVTDPSRPTVLHRQAEVGWPDVEKEGALTFWRDVASAGRTWRIRTKPQGSAFSPAWTPVVIGACLSGALAVLLGGLIPRMVRARRLLRQGAQELERTSQALANSTSQHAASQRAHQQSEAQLRESEALLRRGEAQLRLVMNATPAMIAFIDKDERYVYNNPAHARLHSAAGDISGKKVAEVLGSQRYARVLPHIQTALAGIPTSFQSTVADANGATMQVYASFVPQFDAENQVSGFVSVLTDISELERMREALHDERERAQVTLESIGDAVLTTDSEGRVSYMNAVAERLTGQIDQSWRDKPIYQVLTLLHEDTLQPIEDYLPGGRHDFSNQAAAQPVVFRRDNGQRLPIDCNASPLRDRDGRQIGCVLVFRDVTEQRRAAQVLAHDATHDALTGLLNRAEFERRLNRAISLRSGHSAASVLCYLDLDHFKLVNDTCGHAAGDELLKEITRILQRGVRGTDTLGRLGGDEFGVLLHECSAERAARIADNLRQAIETHRFMWDEKRFAVSCSIGMVPLDASFGSVLDAMNAADAACYAAKEQGRNRAQTFQAGDRVTPSGKYSGWLVPITRALEHDAFLLWAQPVLPCAQGGTQAVYWEVLLRLEDDLGATILPSEAIRAAERYRLASALDRRVIERTLRWLERAAPRAERVVLGINISGASMSEEAMLDYIQSKIQEHRIDPRNLCFEITETSAIANMPAARRFVGTLKRDGCKFALDDFGVGMSSFGYLQELPVDYIKIAGNFVETLHQNRVNRALVEAIQRVGHVMQIPTIAESVANQEILQVLREIGVDLVQGYALREPRPLEQCFALAEPEVSARG